LRVVSTALFLISELNATLMDKDIHAGIFCRNLVDHALDREVAVLVPARSFLVFFVHVFHGVVTDIAGEDFLRLEVPASIRENTRRGIVGFVAASKLPTMLTMRGWLAKTSRAPAACKPLAMNHAKLWLSPTPVTRATLPLRSMES